MLCRGIGSTGLQGKRSLLADKKEETDQCLVHPLLSQQTKGWVMGSCQGLDSRPTKPIPCHGPQRCHKRELQMLLAELNLWPAGEKLSF